MSLKASGGISLKLGLEKVKFLSNLIIRVSFRLLLLITKSYKLAITDLICSLFALMISG